MDITVVALRRLHLLFLVLRRELWPVNIVASCHS
jgi:hypothetical protein